MSFNQQNWSKGRRGPSPGRRCHWPATRGAWRAHPNVLTFPKNPLLGADVRFQLCCSDVNPNGLREVTDGLGHHGLGCVPRLQPGCFKPDIFTLGKCRGVSVCAGQNRDEQPAPQKGTREPRDRRGWLVRPVRTPRFTLNQKSINTPCAAETWDHGDSVSVSKWGHATREKSTASLTGQEANPQTRWRQADRWPCACREAFPCRRGCGHLKGYHKTHQSFCNCSTSQKSWNILLRISTDLQGFYIRRHRRAEQLSSFSLRLPRHFQTAARPSRQAE